MTTTKSHFWVKHTITPVDVVADPDQDNDPIIFVDPEQQDTAENQAVYGCDRCGVSMTEGIYEECKGESDEA